MAIRWDKFTVKAQEAVQQASELASQHGNPELLPVHLLAALARDREGIVVPVLNKLGANPATVEAQAAERITRLPQVSGGAAQPQLSSGLQKILDQAFRRPANSRTSMSPPSICCWPWPRTKINTMKRGRFSPKSALLTMPFSRRLLLSVALSV